MIDFLVRQEEVGTCVGHGEPAEHALLAGHKGARRRLLLLRPLLTQTKSSLNRLKELCYEKGLV
jgi:hypothetical protein